MHKRSTVFLLILIIMISFITSGCTVIFQKGRRVDVEKISKLKSELSNIEKAKIELEKRLKKEIGDSQVKVEMLAKGLVITFVAEVLFDSGKASLKEGYLTTLDKVAQVLNTTVKDLNVGIEGHTDNVPIKHSSWKSNWELSTARALSVLHYLSDERKVLAKRLSATGYGEFRPVAQNSAEQGRQRNRRVEIVILPPVDKKGR
ncbi:MAG: flagellar motor protein MotB [Candidatus Zapsychrus exili]|nr:flagellar motor protein MotB [Candidatus Zapsychrus exili]